MGARILDIGYRVRGDGKGTEDCRLQVGGELKIKIKIKIRVRPAKIPKL